MKHTFFYVYRAGQAKPSVKHTTFHQAEREAHRLSEQHPGDSFEILQCLATVITTKPHTFIMEGAAVPGNPPIYNCGVKMECCGRPVEFCTCPRLA